MRRTDQSGAVRKKLQDYSYLLSQHIGKGYSSQVFRGRNDTTNETVAVKVIDMRMIKGEVHKNLLASEIEVLKSLKNSENIIEVYDIYNTKNNTYIITELCDGGDLAKLIASRRSLPEHEAVPLMNQIINGYNNIHNKGIIHRDLKPANIFLRNQEIKIADFGFAMKQADCRKYSSYNVGSPVYMPPEALNQNKYSFKSDIWALGVIYYEMLTGKTPWRAKTEKQLAKQLTAIPIKKLMPPSLSSSSESFLLRTLTVDINERMNPEELNRFTLNSEKSVISRGLYSTENSIFDGRNNQIRRNQNKNYDRHQTSLTKNSINTPSNLKRLTFLSNQNTQEDYKSHNFSLPKTAATISNKTEHFITATSNHTINNGEALTQKEINTHYNLNTHQQTSTHHNISSDVYYDKKYLSKQLLSQIHFCRFLYKLIIRMNDKLCQEINSQLNVLKEYMVGLIFQVLQDVNSLKSVQHAQDYRQSPDFNKIAQIIEQYIVKYTKDLVGIKRVNTTLSTFKEQLTRNIVFLYEKVQGQQDIGEWKDQVIVLDYLVTLRQLAGLMQANDLEGFHNKSKIETIVEGAPSKTITQEHLSAIRAKLKAIKII